ncbi:hypothetical protein Zmor_014951 [Zophobas morio]|uniref:Uncharacterized protein n=1 Tax=Zophobas morio TaxID=2755281 RepID=A0AA38IKJ0_9CUCU|nr:hypothetical protein Zmor_014951 [Zophobas morio]
MKYKLASARRNQSHPHDNLTLDRKRSTCRSAEFPKIVRKSLQLAADIALIEVAVDQMTLRRPATTTGLTLAACWPWATTGCSAGSHDV